MNSRMLTAVAFGLAVCTFATPAFAGLPLPDPEAGVGIAAMGFLGAGYLYLKRRISRR